MTFRVVEMLQEAGPGKEPHTRTTRRAPIVERAEAVAQAEMLSKRYPKHGWDDEQDHWWGRNDELGSAKHVFIVEGEP